MANARVTVELSVDDDFFENWLDINGEGCGDLTEDLIDQFKNHLEYHIDCMDKTIVPYCATVVGTSKY